MSDFKTRLIEEKQQLDERKDKLQSFIDTSKFDELPEIQKCLLKAQACVMLTYSTILSDRINNL